MARCLQSGVKLDPDHPVQDWRSGDLAVPSRLDRATANSLGCLRMDAPS